MNTARDMVELCATLSRRILAQTTIDGALAALTRTTVDAIPGASYASITRHRATGFQTVGPTHPDAVTNDRTQYRLDSGPCVDAARDDVTTVLVPDLAHDPRYPVFGPAAAATGAASMLSTQLVVDNDDSLRASLNLYSRHPDAFDETAQTIARTVATHGALAAAAVVARDHTTNLERVLMDSRNIGMALGILMASLRLTTDEALTLLRTVSRNRNRTLSEIAADVVATGTLNHPEVPEFDGRGAG